MDRVLLVRRPGGAVLREAGGPCADVADVAASVRERERAGVRWVWDDTTRWYPALLEAGVRVERCTDLRLTHALLRRSPLTGPVALGGPDAATWDALQPRTAAEPGLFPLDDPADLLDPAAEHEAQEAVLAASPHRGRLALLVAAESAGALVAAEMTHAGLPWRADVHGRLLTELLGPRPRAGSGRPCSRVCSPRSGRLSARPTSTRTRRASCCAR